MRRATVLLVTLAGWLSVLPAPRAYLVVLQGSKLQEGGLPSQGGRLDFSVGRNLSTLSRARYIGALAEAWDRWESRMHSGIATAFVDAGEQSFSWIEDQASTIQFVQEGTGFLARTRWYVAVSEPWRTTEVDIKFNKCSGDCWGDCPFLCAGNQREIDLVSIATHEMGHGHGLGHCAQCNTTQTCMVPYLPGGDCALLEIGSIDADICGDIYRRGVFDDHEPHNDLWEGAEDLGTLDGSLIGEEAYGHGDLGGILDNDIFEVYISHQPPAEMRLVLFLMAPWDLDVAFEVYHGSAFKALVDDRGRGGNEWREFRCEGGTWKIRVHCGDLTSNTWSEDPFVLWIYTDMPTQHAAAADAAPAPLTIADNCSATPRIRLAAAGRPARLTLFDASGRLVTSAHLPVATRWEHPCAGLATGVYFARLTGDGLTGDATGRIMVVR